MSTLLSAQRRMTVAFIAAFPVDLILVPRARVRKPAGGYGFEDQPPREPQRMTLVEPPSIPEPVVTLDGIQREVTFQLVGEHDAQVAAYDTFTHGGHEWEVVSVAYFNGWEQRALVSRRG